MNHNSIQGWLGVAIWAIVFAIIVGVAGCGDDSVENTRAAQMRALTKENADLRSELTLRRLPESDQVEAFKTERAQHQVEVNDLIRRLNDANAAGVDHSLAPLQGTLRELRADLEQLRRDTTQQIQDVRGSLRRSGDECRCGR